MKYKITAVLFVLALGGLGILALVGRTDASTPNNGAVTVTTNSVAYNYGNCSGMSGCPASGKWETYVYNISSSSGSAPGLCGEPNLKAPLSDGKAVILNNSTNADNVTITRILILSLAQSNTVYSAFQDAYPSFWNDINTQTNGLSTNERAVIGHILVGKLYSGNYYFVGGYASVFDNAINTINSWFDANFPHEHLNWNLYSSNYDRSDNAQDVLWVEWSPQYVYLDVLKTKSGTDTKLADAQFKLVRVYNGTRTDADTGLETGSDGKLKIKARVALGNNATKYCFVETEAPSGYELDSSDHCVNYADLPAEGGTTTVNISNTLSPLLTPTYTTSAQKCASAGSSVEKVLPISNSVCVSDVIIRGSNFTEGVTYTVNGALKVLGTDETLGNASVAWTEGAANSGDNPYLTFSGIDTTGYGGKTLYVVTTMTMERDGTSVAVGTYNADGSDANEKVTVAAPEVIIKGGFTLTKQRKVGNSSPVAFANVTFHVESVGNSDTSYDLQTNADGVINVEPSDPTYALTAGTYRISEVCNSTVAAYNCSYTEDFAITSDGQKVSLNGGQPIVNVAVIPTITTVARNCNSEADNPSKQLPISSSTCVRDEIQLSSFAVGAGYKIAGRLISVRTGETLKTAEVEWIHSNGVGPLELEFSGINTADHADDTLYVATTIYMLSDMNYIELSELNANNTDANERVNVNGYTINTTAAGASGSTDGQGRLLAGDVTVNDTIEIGGLAQGASYLIQGYIEDGNGNRIVLSNGDASDATYITVPYNMTAATGSDVSTTMVLSFDAAAYAGQTLTVYEKVLNSAGTATIVAHNGGSSQQVAVVTPAIATVAENYDVPGTKTVSLGNIKVVDYVSYSGLKPGDTYTLRASIYKSTNLSTPITTAESTLTPTNNSGTTTANDSPVLPFSTTQMEPGAVLVVYEELYHGDTRIAEHKESNDSNQQITITPIQMGTSAASKANRNIKEFNVGGTAVIEDIVALNGLVNGTSYKVKGWMVDQNGDTVTLLNGDGGGNTITKNYTMAGATGTEARLSIDFEVDTVQYMGKSITVFEQLLDASDHVITSYEILADQNQTIAIKTPLISTMALDGLDEEDERDDVIEPEAEQKIVDTVSYSGLEPNMKYTVTGKIVKKADGSELVINDEAIVGKTEFVAAAGGEGTVEVEFALDATDLPGVDLVVFEKLFVGTDTSAAPIATHENINDTNQNIYVRPRIGTIAADAYDGDQEVGVGNVEIVDKVKYEGLRPGVEYVMAGMLMDKETGREIETIERCKEAEPDDIEDEDEDEDIEWGESDEDESVPCADGPYMVTSETRFTIGEGDTPDTDGVVELSFFFSTRDLAGRELVVFEELYTAEDYTVAPISWHMDLEDESQTIKVSDPEIKTFATDKSDGDKELNYSGVVTLTDKVEYSGLVAGTEYILRGKVINKETGEAITLADGAVNAETIVTAKGKSGYFTMDFEFRTDDVAGKDLVVYEYLYIEDITVDEETDEYVFGEKEIARHEDLSDEGQGVRVKVTPPDTGRMTQGDGSNGEAAGANIIGIVGVFGAVAVVFTIAGRRFWHRGGRHRLFEANRYEKSRWKR